MVAIALFPGDSALLLLLLVVGTFVVLGMITDGLRMAMLFAGTVVAYLLAPLLRNYIPRSFLPDNPLWQDMGVGSIYSFILLMILCMNCSTSLGGMFPTSILNTLFSGALMILCINMASSIRVNCLNIFLPFSNKDLP